MNVLLLGAGGNAGINFAKSLKMSKLNFRVIGVDISERYFDSPYNDYSILMPRLSGEKKVAFINQLVSEHSIDFVHAQPDPEVRFLIENAHDVKSVVGPHTLRECDIFADKLACQAIWRDRLGLKFTCFSLRECLDDGAKFALLAKESGRVWIRAISGAGSRAALPVTSLNQAVNWANYWFETKGLNEKDFMLAEYLPGKEFAVQTVWDKGELISSQARQRIEYVFEKIMPSGQSSTPAVALTVDDKRVYKVAYDAIRAISDSPHGIYCVDLKESAGGSVVPLEINYGRFFTTSDFFSRLGVNGPEAYVASCLQLPYKILIEQLSAGHYWVRGLDREPVLCQEMSGRLVRV